MRIGLITGEYPPLEGGVGHYTALLAENLVVQGHPTFIFSNHHAEQHNDIPVNNTISKWNYRTNQLIKQWTSEKDLDVVNLQFQTAAYDMSAWIHFMPHMVNVPYVTTFHDLRFPYLFPKAGKLRNWIVMHLAKASDEVIATNHEDYAQLAHLKATMIPIGSNIKRVKNFDCDATRQQLNFSSDDFVLAYFGFMNHSKGVDTLLYAISKLNDTRLKLLLIGGRTGTSDKTNQSYADTIDNLIQELELNEQVQWTGFVSQEEVGMYLQDADLVVLPFRDGASFRRGSLMAAIEQTCPILTTTPTVIIPEFLNGSLQLVSPDDVDALAEAIKTLHNYPEHLDILREKVSELRKHFDWTIITEQHINLFSHLIEAQS